MENLLISQIHSSPFQFNFALAGGGSLALSHLLTTPGASTTVVEAHFPYSRESFDLYLGKKPHGYCHKKVTLDLAMKAQERLRSLKPEGPRKNQVGIALTASLSTLREKKGEERFYLAACGNSFSHLLSATFGKGESTRLEEEEFISECLQFIMAKVCGLEKELPRGKVQFEYEEVQAKEEWKLVLEGKKEFFSYKVSGSPKLIFPGSFNSLHSGHLEMKRIAEERLGELLSFEIALSNADKSALSFYELDRVLAQFDSKHPYILTSAPTFARKAELFPSSTFVIGFDTLVRIFDSKFYENEKDMFSKLDIFHEQDINFLVFGRKLGDSFKSLEDFNLPERFSKCFTGVSEEEFRDDVSSTELRRRCFL